MIACKCWQHRQTLWLQVQPRCQLSHRSALALDRPVGRAITVCASIANRAKFLILQSKPKDSPTLTSHASQSMLAGVRSPRCPDRGHRHT